MTQAVLQKYQTQQIMSASPAKLVAMLIDKAVACLSEASAAMCTASASLMSVRSPVIEKTLL